VSFVKIWILTDSKEQQLGEGLTPVLFNVQNIVSIKPIRIPRGDDIINGYWIRTTNNKKYRASKIPAELEKLFNGDKMSSDIINTIDARNDEFISQDNLH
jgi:hypothetical protein